MPYDSAVPTLLPITSKEDIPERYRNSPVELLLEYHNLGRAHDEYANAQMLIGMCMDNRKQLSIPHNFSFIIRAGGANLRHSEFKVSFAIGVGNVRCITLIGHNHCGMVNLAGNKEKFICGLMENAGWTRQEAEEHFREFAPKFEITNEMDFILSEVKRLQSRYPKILIAPMLYRVEDSRLYMIQEDEGA